jgi:hypothetical protein
MSEKENLLLSDPDVIPTDEYIFSILGNKKDLWQAIMEHIRVNYEGSAGEWNFYNDGKRWLFKMMRKKKTLFWCGILKDTFRITFYFGDKAEPLIDRSDLPQEIKKDFKTGKHYGAIRAISMKMNDSQDVEIVKKLITIKVKLI